MQPLRPEAAQCSNILSLMVPPECKFSAGPIDQDIEILLNPENVNDRMRASQTSNPPHRTTSYQRTNATAHRALLSTSYYRQASIVIYYVSHRTPTMSLFTTNFIEEKIPLTVAIIDAILLCILLLIATGKATSTATTLTMVSCVLLVLLLLFMHDQIYTISKPEAPHTDDVHAQ